jgi:hypothetical protein
VRKKQNGTSDNATPRAAVEDSGPGIAFSPPDAGAVEAIDAAAAPAVVAIPTGADDGGAPQGRVFATATWGSQLGQLGHERPQEANPEGPMSMTTDAQGNVYVLDQVNHRLVRYDRNGRAQQAIPLSQTAPQDVQIARNGNIAILDRHGDSNVTLMSPDGRTLGSLPITGTGLAEAGAATALMVDGDNVYVEREHGPLIRIGTTDGTPDSQREEIPGRPTRDGQSYISAGLVDQPTGRFYVNSVARDTGDHRWTRQLQVQLSLLGILLLDTDRQGVIYTAVVGVPQGAEEVEGNHDIIGLLCLDPTDGPPIGQTSLPPNTVPEESFRDMVVLDEGGILYQHRTDQGVTLERYNCQ